MSNIGNNPSGRRNDNREYIVDSTDFPTPISGISYLESDKIYDLRLSTVTIDFTISWPEDGNCKIQNGTLIYTGTGTLFQNAEMGDNVKRLSDLFLVATNPCTLFDLTGTNPAGVFVIDNMAIVGFAALGSMEGFLFTCSVVRYLNFGTGFTFTNMSTTNLSRTIMIGTNQSTTFLTFDGTTQGVITFSEFSPTINTNECLFDFKSTVTYSGVTANGIPVNLAGSATNDCVFAPGSYTQKSIGFKFSDGVNIPDSTASIELGFQNNVTETVIDQVLVPVRIKGTYANGFDERFTYTSDGKAIFQGLEETTVSARSYCSLRPVTGISILMGVYIAHTKGEITEITFDNTTNTINCTGHGLSNDTSIRLSTTNTLPAEFRDDHFYWIVNKTDNTFQLSRTEGGGVYAFTDDGTGTHYFSLGEYKEVSEVTAAPSSTQELNFSVEALVEIDTDDYIEVFVDNHDTTSNIICRSINFICKK